MKQEKIILIVAIIALVILVLTSFQLKGVSIRVSNVKPRITGEFIKDPDFIYNPPESVWYDGGDGITSFENVIYSTQTADGRSNFIIIHPLSITQPRFMEQNVTLPSGKHYRLNVGLNNVAGKIKALAFYVPKTIEIVSSCDDNTFSIKVISGTQTFTISNVTTNAKNGWHDISYDISNFAGQSITVRIESYMGSCNNFEGAWGAVDYVDIASS